MSDRERWIVYPLLFFSCLRPVCDLLQLQEPQDSEPRVVQCDRLVADRVECKKLRSVSIVGIELRTISLDGELRFQVVENGEHGGMAEFYGAGETPLATIGVDETGQQGVVETKQVSGNTLVKLSANDSGGVVETWNLNQQLLVQLGGTQEGGKLQTFMPEVTEEQEPSEASEEQEPSEASEEQESPGRGDEQPASDPTGRESASDESTTGTEKELDPG